jgi:hypothetical protein
MERDQQAQLTDEDEGYDLDFTGQAVAPTGNPSTAESADGYDVSFAQETGAGETAGFDPEANPEVFADIQARNDEMTKLGRFSKGVQEGLGNIGRGAMELAPFVEPGPRDPLEVAAQEDRSERYPWSATSGEIVGEALPFAVGSLGAQRFMERAGVALWRRIAAQTGIGSIEGATVAAGRGQDVPMGMAIGAGVALSGEVVGAYIGRGLRSLYRSVRGGAPKEPVIDAAGELSEEMTRVAQEAGVEPDELIDMVVDLAAESPEAAAVSAAVQAEGAMQRGTTGELRQEIDAMRRNEQSAAMSADPDPEIMAAAEALDVDSIIPASAVSRSRSFQEMEQALKNDPNSGLGQAEDVFVNRMREIADETVTEFGGMLDRGELDTAVRGQFERTQATLYDMSEQKYAQLSEAIPSTTDAPMGYSRDYLAGLETDYGANATSLMNGSEKRLAKIIQNADEAEEAVTYAALDRLRKDVGASLGTKASGSPFPNDDVGRLKSLYEVLLRDQEAVASYMGDDVADLFTSARATVSARKGLEERMQELFGRKLDQMMVGKLDKGVKALTTGDFQQLNKMMTAIPAPLREQAAATMLNTMFTAGARSERVLSQGFVDFYEGITRSPKAKEFFFRYLPDGAEEKMDNIYKVSAGLKRALRFQNTSGTARGVLVNLDKGGWLDRVYGVAAKSGAAELAAAKLGVPVPPGTATLAIGALESMMTRTPRSEAADQLLRSPKFRDALVAVARKNGAKEADDALRGTRVFREWLELQEPGVASAIAGTGFVPWLVADDEVDAEAP